MLLLDKGITMYYKLPRDIKAYNHYKSFKCSLKQFYFENDNKKKTKRIL